MKQHLHNNNTTTTTHPLSPFTSASKHDQVAMLLGLLAKNNITMEQLLSMSEEEQKSLLISLVDANNRGDVTFDSCKGHLDLATALKGILDKNNNAKRAKEVTNLSASAIAVKTAKYDMEHRIHSYSNSNSSSSSVAGNALDGHDEDSNSMGDARRNMLEVIKRRSQQQQQQASSTATSGSSYGGINSREDNDDVTINGNVGGTNYYTVGDHQRASSFTLNTPAAAAVDYTTPSQILISQSEFAKYFKMVKVGDIFN